MRSRDLGVHMHPLHPIWLRLWKAGPVWGPLCGPLFDRTCWTWELHASKSAPVTVTCGGAHKSDMIAQCPPVVGVLRTAPGPISAAANGSGLVEQAGNSGAYRGAQW